MATAKSREVVGSAADDPTLDDAPEATGSEAMLQEYLEQARAIPEDQVQPMRADPILAMHNIQFGLTSLEPHWQTLAEALPQLDTQRVKNLDGIGLGLVFASGQVDRKAGSAGRTRTLLRRGVELRTVMLASADALSKAGLIPGSAIKKIRAGAGPIDLANDVVQLGALFRKHAAEIKGKSPITATIIKEAGSVGTDLLGVLKPKAAKRKPEPSPELDAAVDIRDRMWTLLVLGHRDMRRAGMWLWVDDVNDYVPSLQSRRVRRKKTETKEEEAKTNGEGENVGE